MRKTTEERKKFINLTPDTTVDTVLVTLHNDTLKVLLTQRSDKQSDPFPNQWGLPGVYFNVEKDINVFQAAVRGLTEKAQLDTIPHIETLDTFSEQNRDPRWHTLTVVNIGYVNYETIRLHSDKVKFFSFDDIQSMDLAFDHKEIIEFALKKVRKEAQISAKVINFLDNKFSQPELQSLFETVLETELDKSSFRKQVRQSDLLVETGDRIKPKKGKPALLYKVNPNFDINNDWFFPRSVAKNK
tara:strand:- start:77 stop:805 length:729 start_codon:yes stop_codon:yes gene_type:complete